MNKNRLLWQVFSSVICSGFLSFSFAGANHSKDFNAAKHLSGITHKHHKMTLLFIQQAKSASMTREQHCFSLSLKHPNKKVLYFSDEPKRITGKLTIQEFLQTWQANNIKPNVAILAFTPSGKEIHQIALLSQPKFDAQKAIMTYAACPLPGQQLKTFANLKDINIFFDKFEPWPP